MKVENVAVDVEAPLEAVVDDTFNAVVGLWAATEGQYVDDSLVGVNIKNDIDSIIGKQREE